MAEAITISDTWQALMAAPWGKFDRDSVARKQQALAEYQQGVRKFHAYLRQRIAEGKAVAYNPD